MKKHALYGMLIAVMAMFIAIVPVTARAEEADDAVQSEEDVEAISEEYAEVISVKDAEEADDAVQPEEDAEAISEEDADEADDAVQIQTYTAAASDEDADAASDADATAEEDTEEEEVLPDGFNKINGSWYYVSNGAIVTKQNLYQDKEGRIDKAGDWWYVTSKGKVDKTFTNLAQNHDSGNWWYVKKGKVDKSVTNLVKNKDSGNWWYVKKGKVRKDYTGVAQNKDSGNWWYVYKGKVLFDKNSCMTYAARFVGKNTKASWSKSKKLKTCYNIMVRDYKYKRYYDNLSPKASDMSGFAVDMLKTKRGNCFRYAAAFACIAKAIGYESRVAVGGVSSSPTRGLSPHGWTEIKIGGKWYQFDVNMKINHPSWNFYKVTNSSYPCRHKCNARYRLRISGGKVKWS